MRTEVVFGEVWGSAAGATGLLLTAVEGQMVPKMLATLLAVVTAAIVYFVRWVVRTAAQAPGMTDQRPTRSAPVTKSDRDRARLAAYSARRSN